MSVWDEEPDSLRMFYDLAVAEALKHEDIQTYLSLNRAEINASALRGVMREDAVANAVLDDEERYDRLWRLGQRLDRSRAPWRRRGNCSRHGFRVSPIPSSPSCTPFPAEFPAI